MITIPKNCRWAASRTSAPAVEDGLTPAEAPHILETVTPGTYTTSGHVRHICKAEYTPARWWTLPPIVAIGEGATADDAHFDAVSGSAWDLLAAIMATADALGQTDYSAAPPLWLQVVAGYLKKHPSEDDLSPLWEVFWGETLCKYRGDGCY